MKSKTTGRFAALFAVALLVLAPAASALALGDDMGDDKVALTGQLSQNDQGEYVLIEQASGDTIALEGSEELDEHVGSAVKVHGKWKENGVFKVSRVEAMPAVEG